MDTTYKSVNFIKPHRKERGTLIFNLPFSFDIILLGLNTAYKSLTLPPEIATWLDYRVNFGKVDT